MNAVTMLGQSKNAFQAEIDCVAELAELLPFQRKKYVRNIPYATEFRSGVWNRTVWRPLEGFVFALYSIHFTSTRVTYREPPVNG